jgi:hypothetical protein
MLDIYEIRKNNLESFSLYRCKNYHDPLRSLFVAIFKCCMVLWITLYIYIYIYIYMCVCVCVCVWVCVSELCFCSVPKWNQTVSYTKKQNLGPLPLPYLWFAVTTHRGMERIKIKLMYHDWPWSWTRVLLIGNFIRRYLERWPDSYVLSDLQFVIQEW